MINTYLTRWKVIPAVLLLFLLSLASFAQDMRISGRVLDTESNNGLPGVNVLLKGTTKGVTTDANGGYTITVPGKESVLVFSFVGFIRQEVKAGNRNSISVNLTADATSLQEVVVTGYAAQQRKDITGSVAVVDVKEMRKLPAGNIADQLQGRIAGVQVSSSGDPGSAGASVRSTKTSRST